jgi:beta-glucanase (GH16 family)
VLVGVAAGCSSPTAAVDKSWTEKPSVTSVQDAGTATADAAPPDEPPEQLCTLTGPPTSTPGDVLVFADEFEGADVDAKKWNIGAGKRGPTTVINTTSPTNATVRDGSLFIRVDNTSTDPTYPYTAGYIESLGKFARTYGRVEFRARFPYAAGVWHALWGRSWFEAFPEIDVEILNTAAVAHSQVYFVNHWAAPPIPADERRTFVTFSDTDVSTFHTYSVSWKPGMLEWAIDGVTKMQSDPRGVPTKPVYWIINSWVGGWAGTPPSTTTMPVTFEVDYVRVYRVDGLIADPEVHVVNPAPQYARTDAIKIAAANFDEACAHVEMYDGDTLVRTTSAAPYQFSLARLTAGAHNLRFVATDGTRTTTTALDAQIK